MLERQLDDLETRRKRPDVHIVAANHFETVSEAIKRVGAVPPFVFVPAKHGDHHGKS